MKVTIEQQKNSEVKLIIELTKEDMSTHEECTVKHLAKDTKVDGFRPGKAPAEAIKKQMGEQAFTAHVLDHALSHAYEDAIRENEVQPVDYPKINIVSNDPLKFEATVAVIPSVEWKKDVSKLSIKAEKVKVEKKDIDEVKNNLKSSNTKWTEVDRKAKKGDRVELDFSGFDEEGKALDGTASQHHPLILGSGNFIPGFEEEVEGVKKDDEKEFQVTFPKDYHREDFQNKKVTFKIKVHMVEESSEPELDDEFAKMITGGKRETAKELEEEIKEELLAHKEKQEEARQETEFLKSLLDYVKIDMPQAVIERETDFLLQRMQDDFKRQRQDWDGFVASKKDGIKTVREELANTAKENATIRLALEDLYKTSKIEVTDKEMEEQIADFLSRFPAELQMIAKERYKKGSQEYAQLENQARLRKLVAKHVKKATK